MTIARQEQKEECSNDAQWFSDPANRETRIVKSLNRDIRFLIEAHLARKFKSVCQRDAHAWRDEKQHYNFNHRDHVSILCASSVGQLI